MNNCNCSALLSYCIIVSGWESPPWLLKNEWKLYIICFWLTTTNHSHLECKTFRTDKYEFKNNSWFQTFHSKPNPKISTLWNIEESPEFLWASWIQCTYKVSCQVMWGFSDISVMDWPTFKLWKKKESYNITFKANQLKSLMVFSHQIFTVMVILTRIYQDGCR